MELKEVIAVFRGEIIRLEEQLKSVDMVYREQRLKVRIEALQTAISHLETLQKVKEAGGVKRKGVYENNYSNGWNDCLDAVHAELAGKLVQYYNCDNPNCGKGAICNYCALRKDLMGIF